MSTNRREVLKALTLTATAALAEPGANGRAQARAIQMHIVPGDESSYAPLDKLTLRIAGDLPRGAVEISDGDGRVYVRSDAAAALSFTAAGALGRQTARLLDERGKLLGEVSFTVDCATEIRDSEGTFASLMNSVLWTMMSWSENTPALVIRRNDRVYEFFANWIFDHTLILKGMKYFWPGVKDAIDFFADTQREDGMIWENCYPATPTFDYFDWKFGYDGFVRRFGGGAWQLRRAPVESHVEQYFVDGLYSTWQVTGDVEWMKGKLDAAMRALRFVTKDPYRWSEKHQLMHRGFTIDTWDYISDDQQKLGGSVFNVYPGKSEFGIFHGDNTNFVAQCRNLSTMLRAAGRGAEAPEFETLADGVEKRLNALSWNGEFYTHWIAENPEYKPDLGVDMSRQVSLSNAYALNRGIAHDKCAAVLRTYQKIRREMPAGSPGEFYGIYPPFQRGFTQNEPGLVWEYCNGGVLTVVGGELAHGAFEHGFEAYGADILRRLKAIADRHRGYLPVTLRGKPVEAPERTFSPLPIGSAANATHGLQSAGMQLWSSDPAIHLAGVPTGRQRFCDVPFDVLSPSSDPRTCMILSREGEGAQRISIPAGAKAASVYLLNAMDGGDSARATLTFHYADGKSHAQNVQSHGWFFPADTQYSRSGPRTRDTYRVAWKWTTPDKLALGVYATGVDNPHPEREIASLDFSADGSSGRWLVLGVTLSTVPVFFAPWDDLSTGIPDGWAGSVIYALVEGLAGVKDAGAGFDCVRLSPRWAAAGETQAEVRVRYPASRGYVAYRYQYDEAAQSVSVEVASGARQTSVTILLPEGKRPGKVSVNGRQVESAEVRAESSLYASVELTGQGAQKVEMDLI